jgi:hypothetical protein
MRFSLTIALLSVASLAIIILAMGPSDSKGGGGATISIVPDPPGTSLYSIVVTPDPGVAVGALLVNVNHNPVHVYADPDFCTATLGIVCNPVIDADTSRVAGANLAGLSGPVVSLVLHPTGQFIRPRLT